jgi:hypothetical protein
MDRARSAELKVSIEDFLEHVINGKLLLFTAVGTEPKNGSLAVLKIVFDLQIHDCSDPAAGIGQNSKQGLVPTINDVSSVDWIHSVQA